MYDVMIIMHNFAKNSKFNDVLGPAWYFVKHDLVWNSGENYPNKCLVHNDVYNNKQLKYQTE